MFDSCSIVEKLTRGNMPDKFEKEKLVTRHVVITEEQDNFLRSLPPSSISWWLRNVILKSNEFKEYLKERKEE